MDSVFISRLFSYFLVTNSLAALSRGLVFCTEPFRIPFAGKLDVLCFDKTGTLTMDKMVLKGVVGSPESRGQLDEQDYSISSLLSLQGSVSSTVYRSANNNKDNNDNNDIDNGIEEIPSLARAITTITDPSTPTCAEISLSIMAACHSLIVAPETGATVGDPLETATMDSSGFHFIRCVLKTVYL